MVRAGTGVDDSEAEAEEAELGDDDDDEGQCHRKQLRPQGRECSLIFGATKYTERAEPVAGLGMEEEGAAYEEDKDEDEEKEEEGEENEEEEETEEEEADEARVSTRRD